MENKKRIILRKLTSCSLENQLKIREIRNSKNIRNSMYTDHEIDLNEHLNWIKNLKNNNTKLVFAIFKKTNIPIGVISVDSLDNKNKKASWSFYLEESSRAGLGAFLEYEFLNFIFDDLKLEKLNWEVLENNSAVIKMHKKFNFKDEGFKRSYIQKGNNRLG